MFKEQERIIEKLKAMKMKKVSAVKNLRRAHKENQGVGIELPIERAKGLEKEAALATVVDIDMIKTMSEDTDMN